MSTHTLSPKSRAAFTQILAIEALVAQIGEEEVVARCHDVVSALGSKELVEIASTVRDCAIRAQRCAVQVLKDMHLLALGLAIGGANKLTNASAVVLYQQHVGNVVLPGWIRAIIKTKLGAVQAAIVAAQFKTSEPPTPKKPTVVAKPAVMKPQPVAVKPVSASVVVVVPVVVEAPKPKSLREQLQEQFVAIRGGMWSFRTVYELRDGATAGKLAKVADLLAEIEAEKPACFDKIRDSVAMTLKKAGYGNVARAILHDDCGEAEEALALVVKCHAPGVPGWVFGPIHYRLDQLRVLARKRQLAEVDGVAEELAKLVGGIGAALQQAWEVPDLLEVLLTEAESMFGEAKGLFCEFWALEELIVAGGIDTFVGRKITDDREFGAIVLAKPVKQRAQEFRRLLLDEGFSALEKLRKLVADEPTVIVSRHDGKHGRVRSKHPNLLANHRDSHQDSRHVVSPSRQ